MWEEKLEEQDTHGRLQTLSLDLLHGDAADGVVDLHLFERHNAILENSSLKLPTTSLL